VDVHRTTPPGAEPPGAVVRNSLLPSYSAVAALASAASVAPCRVRWWFVAQRVGAPPARLSGLSSPCRLPRLFPARRWRARLAPVQSIVAVPPLAGPPPFLRALSRGGAAGRASQGGVLGPLWPRKTTGPLLSGRALAARLGVCFSGSRPQRPPGIAPRPARARAARRGLRCVRSIPLWWRLGQSG
jgi:hypothetical protein